MRRFAFHIIISLAAFLTGTFIAVGVLNQSPNITQETKTIDTQNGEQKNKAIVIDAEKPLLPIAERFTCEDASLLPFWNQLKKHENFKNIEEFYKRVDWNGSNGTYDCSYFFRVNERIDLNGDGEDEVLVQGINTGFCEMTGDCENYIFEKKNDAYDLILFESYSIEYKVKDSRTKGYFDIEFRDNDKLGDGGLRIYKFNGKNYRLNKSFRVISRVFKNGDFINFNPPKIVPTKCVDSNPERMRSFRCEL